MYLTATLFYASSCKQYKCCDSIYWRLKRSVKIFALDHKLLTTVYKNYFLKVQTDVFGPKDALLTDWGTRGGRDLLNTVVRFKHD